MARRPSTIIFTYMCGSTPTVAAVRGGNIAHIDSEYIEDNVTSKANPHLSYQQRLTEPLTTLYILQDKLSSTLKGNF